MWSKISLVVITTILGSTALVMAGFFQIVQPGAEGTTEGAIMIGLGILVDVVGAIWAASLVGSEHHDDEAISYSPPAAVER
jgi:uncharacterized membrane protein YbhN (UPF0104 family)